MRNCQPMVRPSAGSRGARATPSSYMARPRRPLILMILLIGNYPLERQQSMERFAMMMLDGLHAAGTAAELIRPQPFLGRIQFIGNFVAKWLVYLDKFIFFRRAIARKSLER